MIFLILKMFVYLLLALVAGVGEDLVQPFRLGLTLDGLRSGNASASAVIMAALLRLVSR